MHGPADTREHAVNALRQRLPAVGITVLFHIAVLALLLQTKFAARQDKSEIELPIVLPQPAPQGVQKRKSSHRNGGSTAITPYFDPRRFNPNMLEKYKSQGLRFSIEDCAPEKYDMQADEIRMACNRIGSLIANDPGRFGINAGIAHGKQWARELAKYQRPLLLPCASSNGVYIDLLCVLNLVVSPYDSDKVQHYSK